MLRFTNRRVLPPAPSDGPWLVLEGLTPSERAQLLTLLRLFDPDLDADALASLSYATMREPMKPVAECPIEWWDVVDARGLLHHRLWLYAADGGWLFVGPTDTFVPEGSIAAGAFYGQGWEGDAPGSLAERLHEAQGPARFEHPGSELARVAFVDRPSEP